MRFRLWTPVRSLPPTWLERLNKEIRRRTGVVGIFPSPDSYLRLVTADLLEYAEDWSSSRAYLSPQALQALPQNAA